ncbi:MAG TPA: NAD(P)/FAD-dependent oxidoreductase [Pseudolabrys sp.]|nr:NAD(P)/FAD-dependent oxidoreductase [Pseudolabrys sp.]
MDARNVQSNAVAAATWLTQFDRALAQRDTARLRGLFHAESYWRDLAALTWRIGTVAGAEAIINALLSHAAREQPRGFALDAQRTAPRLVKRAGSEAIEAIFRFETAQGRGNGVLRLTPDPADATVLKAWTLLTALDEIKGHEEQRAGASPDDKIYARDFHGPNWLDMRETTAAFANREPTVLVVGAGQAGLCIAARLNALQIDTLVVEHYARVGDNWRHRYHALVLHNQVHVNHLPYMPFPPTWPAYIPKDKLAGWFESYAEAMELNVWTSTDFLGGSYDEKAQRWSVTVRRADGSMRELRPKHVVMATGASGIPNMPEIPSLKDFRGAVLHSSQYGDSEKWAGKRALIIGTGTSGHDIAQDLHSAGAQVTLVQRSSTMIINVEPSAQLPYELYGEGPPLEDCDLATAAMPLPLSRKSHVLLTQRAKAIDQPLLDALERLGFRLDFGDDGTGWQFKYLTRGGGYYFNVGCSDLIVRGEIGFAQFTDIERFVAEGARLRDGKTLPADLIVLATGYKGQDVLVRKLFGDAVADRVGPIWGFGTELELRNMFTRTAQPGLWFIAGSFAQCRIYSKYLSLQIKAEELGLAT